MKVKLQTQRATEWLRTYLEERGGSGNSTEIQAAARLEGISKGTLWRACNTLGITSTRDRKWIPSSTWEMDE